MTSKTRTWFATIFLVCLTAFAPGSLFSDEKPNNQAPEAPEKKVEDANAPKKDATPPENKTEPAPSPASTPPAVAVPKGNLPWAKSDANPAATTTRKTLTARELLVNLDDSQLQAFMDGRSLVVDEDESLIRVLFRVPKFGQNAVEELARDPGDWKAFFDEPDNRRVQIYRLRGRVQKVERSDLIPEQRDRYDYDHFYRVTMQLADSPYRATICTQSVPEAWKQANELDESATAFGLFLKVGDREGEHPELVFAAPRIAWHPDKANSTLGVIPDQVILASLGFDISLFDDIRGPDDKHTRNGKDTSPEESECIHQMLMAVHQTTHDKLKPQVTIPFDLPPLLLRPREQHGKLMTIQGVARRITRIDVENPETRKRFGLDHYYEVYVYVPLGNMEIRLAGDKNDKQSLVIGNAFPVTCNVTRIPPKWESIAKGSNDLHENVRITGFNFKLWAFQTQMLQRYAADQAERAAKKSGTAKTEQRRPLQTSPWFIGPDVEFLPENRASHDAANRAMTFAVVLIFCGIGGTALALWLFRRSDRVARNTIRKLHQENPDSPTNPSSDKPDFSGLG